ncbi:hypothetical protein JYK14_15235 [Siccirubricoccus sp. KC 17139]|uniref:Sel1 repeat family protein n=1 Tax=Siccirubricoccus soli TaxID=2899147 RepID=A0ABT1D6F0_9PROT|nr:hypothetical protein [Siccirubricoccus soli]MCO6417504.1 hypothetical protein [Siccirubricoccus soli]MCP2683639.1 hypothetical protein [Siccirubricoccus soli]
MSEGSVRRHPTRGAGYAELRLPGAAAAVEDPRFRLYWEPHHDPYLGPNGWQAAEAVLHPEEAAVEGRDLLLTLGPAICEHLETDTYEVILLAFPNGRFVVPWVEIPRRPRQGRGTVVGREAPHQGVGTVGGGGATGGGTTGGGTTGGGDAVQDGGVPGGGGTTLGGTAGGGDTIGGGGTTGGDTITGGEAERPPPKPLWPWLLLLLLLLAAAGGAWWWFRNPPPAPVPEAGPRTEAPPSPAPPLATPSPGQADACLGEGGVPAGQQTARDVAGRSGCQPAEYVRIAEAMREAGRHDDALLLLEAAAERGVGGAMAALGRMYDPNGFRPGQPFNEPDPRQAARWYRDAERAGEAGVAGPRAALRSWLQQQAQQGDSMARLTLEDFWP